MSALVFGACVLSGVIAWCLGAVLLLQARRDYRGPSGRTLWINPFALWEPTNYVGAGVLRIRRSLLCFVIFIACVGLGLIVSRSSGR